MVQVEKQEAPKALTSTPQLARAQPTNKPQLVRSPYDYQLSTEDMEPIVGICQSQDSNLRSGDDGELVLNPAKLESNLRRSFGSQHSRADLNRLSSVLDRYSFKQG